jgi:hypothetical protein
MTTYIVRTYHGGDPMLIADLSTKDPHAAAEDVCDRATIHGWANVGVEFDDGFLPLRGERAKNWAYRTLEGTS